jgi:hypothetical protein
VLLAKFFVKSQSGCSLGYFQNFLKDMAPPVYGDLGKQARDVFGKVSWEKQKNIPVPY